MSHWTSVISRELIKDFFYKNSGFTAEEVVNNVENFTEIFSLLQELHILQYFIPHFNVTRTYAKEMDSHMWYSVFNVVKQFMSKHVLNVHHTFHTSSMSFCEAQYGLID